MVVTDGHRLLIGHATRSPRWDIPKGQAEAGETPEAAARRELAEETGLSAADAPLRCLGRHAYLPRKDLALYVWQRDPMPEPSTLTCRSMFQIGRHSLPEFDRFACPSWDEALPLLGKGMQALLRRIAAEQGWACGVNARAGPGG